MATLLDLIDFDEALLIKAERRPSFIEALMSAVATGVFAAIVGSLLAWKRVTIACTVLAASAAFLWARRTKRFELRITQQEFVARGKVGDNFGLTRRVRPPEVQRLEYQEDTTGPETSHHPQGLYAVLQYGSICLMPDVDEQQTAEIVGRIVNKFPDACAHWGGPSTFGKHFTSLGLNDTTL